jgi:hypothetical protein
MNDQLPAWSSWKTPAPSPHFDQRVWQKLDAARNARPTPAAWWEGWALAGAWAGAAALILVSVSQTLPTGANALFAPVGQSSLTEAYVSATKGNLP